MTFSAAARRLAAPLLVLLSLLLPAQALEPLRAHPQNPYLVEFRGKPEVLVTYAEHYSSVVNKDFSFIPYLNVMERDGMNLTRVFLAGFRHDRSLTLTDPLAPPPASFMQPWKRVEGGDPAIDGLAKWDLTQWDEAYFARLHAFMQACSDRGIVVELTFFSTFYTNVEWQCSPFNAANNIQGHGPTSRYDAYRLVSPGLLAAQEAFVRRLVREVNGYDNLIYEIQNEPFWNEPGVRDNEEVAFHNRMLEAVRAEETTLPNRHLVAHNFPQQASAMSEDFDIIDEHYPSVVLGSPVAGAENLLRDHYSRGKILAMGETDTVTAPQARLEAWMFLLGGGGIYNGLDFRPAIYQVGTEAGDTALGRSLRKAISDAAVYSRNLHLVAVRRDLSWISGDLPAGSTLQAMSSPGQQYVAYLHHGKSQQTNFQLVYDPIDATPQTIAPVVQLETGTWRAVWTRPVDMTVIATEEFTHEGGAKTLAGVTYQEDVALRIDRTGAGDLTPPPAPAGLVAAQRTDGSIDLSWTAAQSPDVVLHRVYRTETAAVPLAPEYLLGEVSMPDTTFSDASLTIGTSAHYRITAVDANGNESSPGDGTDSTATLENLPYGGVPRDIPGIVEAEDFDVGGQGVAYHDTTPSNSGGQYRPDEDVDIEITTDTEGGHHLADTTDGEWLEYTLQVAQAGVYHLSVRVAGSPAGGTLAFSTGGVAVGPAAVIPAATETTWQTVVIPEVVLPAGRQVLRATLSTSANDVSAGAINRFTFTPVEKTGPTADAGPDLQVADHDFDGFASIPLDASASTPGDAPLATYSWSLGSTVVASGISPLVPLPRGDHIVRLTATDSNGLSGTAELSVRVVLAEFANDGFESGFTGWTATGNVSVQSGSPYVPTQGSKLVAFNNSQSTPNGTLSRIFATTPGQIYQLTFDMGVFAYNNLQQRLQVEVSGNALLQSQTHVTNRLNNQPVRWESKTLNFTADSEATTLTFRDISNATDSLDLTLDNVRVIPQLTRVLTVSSSAGSTAVTVSPLDGSGQGGGNTDFSRSYQNATTVTLTAPATSGTLSFQKWRKNGVDLASTPSVSVLMDGDHALTAVYIEGPPVITNQPASTTVSPGGTATFSVTATGNPAPSYQWRFGGGIIAGATGSTLTIPDAEAADTGSYDVVVTGPGGSVTSNPATLSVVATGALVNGSFEDGYTGWTVTGNQSIQTASLYTATQGTRLVAFNNGQSVPNGVLSQTFATTPGRIYQLNFDMGVLAYNNSQQQLQVRLSGNSQLFQQTYAIVRLNNQMIRWDSKTLLFTADSASTTLAFRDVSTTSNSLDLTLDNVRIIPQITRTLTVTSSPAAGAPVTITPADTIGRTDGTTSLTRTYQNATIVTLTAPATIGGQAFQKWRKNGSDLVTTRSVSVAMDGDHTLTAVYFSAITRTLTVGSSPASGVSIAVSLPDSNGESNGTSSFTRVYPDQAVVTLTAPVSIPGFTFQRWLQNANPFSLSPEVEVHMDGDQNVTAVYVPVVRTLSVESSNAATAISISPADNNGLDSGTTDFTRAYPDSASVTLTAPALPGFTFQKWQKNTVDFATTPAVTVLMDASHTLRAVYVPIVRTLTVESSNAGTAVTVSPSDNNGLTGGTTTFSRVYPDAASVTLTAPPLSGHTFQKWQKNSADLATTPTVTVLMDANHTLRAVYLPIVRTLTVESSNAGTAVTVTPADNNGLTGGTTTFSRVYPDAASVTLTAPSLSGHTFQKWQKNSTDLATTPTVTVLMDANHTLRAVYLPIVRTLTVESSNAGTAVTVSPSDNNGMTGGTTTFSRLYPDATTITLTAQTIPGFTFQKWVKNGSDLATTPSVTVLMAANHTLRAVYVPIVRTLTVESSNAGTAVTISPADNNGLAGGNTSFTRGYADSATVTLIAPAISGFTFQKWQKNAVDLATTPSVTVLMDANHILRAVYIPIVRTLTVESSNAGTAIAVSPVDNNGLGGGSAGFARNYPEAVTVTLTAPASIPGFTFQKWRKNGADLATIPTASVMMDANHTLSAIYVPVVRTLTVESTPGGTAVIISPADNTGLTGGTTAFTRAYPDAASVTLTAPASISGYTFQKWQKNSTDLATTPAVTVLMDANHTLRAVYVPIIRALTVESSNAGTTIAVTPADNNAQSGGVATFTRAYPDAASVTLTAPALPGFNFQKWQKNSADLATTLSVTVLMDANHTLRAVYVPIIRTLTVESSNAGTAVTLSPADNNGQSGGTTTFTRAYPDGASVTLTAPSLSGHTFQKWQKNSTDFATTPAVTVVMDANHTLRAVYAPIIRTLTVESSNAGTSVTVTPADNNGLTGGTATFTRSYPDAATVTLTAQSIPGFTFQKWVKNGSDHATTPSISVNMDGDHTLGAFYIPITRTLTVASSSGGSPVSISPADNNGLASGTTTLTRIYQDDTAVTLTKPGTSGGLVFQKWQKNGVDHATTLSVSVVMDADHALTAIYVEGPPVISSQPSDMAVAAGATATFSVSVTSLSTPAYQWRFNGTNLSGATAATLSIPNVQAANAGSYDVVVTTPGGSVTSDAATLALTTPVGTLVNGSFEDGYTGWTTTGNQGLQTASLYTATDGTRLVSFNNNESTPNGVLSQTFATTPGQSYVLNFDMGVLAYNNLQQRLQVQVTGATLLVNQTHVTNRLNNQIIRWENKSHPFIADSNSTTLTFRDVSTATNALDLTLDRVRIIPQITRTLTVTSAPVSGIVIGISPLDNSGLGSAATGFSRTYANATTVTLTAPASTSGRTFQKWQRNGIDLATSPTVSVLLDGDHTLTAVYVTGGSSIPSALKILPLGDSITFGYDGNNAGYRGPLYSLLGPMVPGFQYLGTTQQNPGSLPATPVDQRFHQGLSAYNILDVTNNLDGLDTTRFTLLGGSDKNPNGGYWLTGGGGTGRQPMFPDIITMMIGTNDLGNPTGVENRLRNLVTKITTLRPDTKLFLAKITPASSYTAQVASYNNSVTTMVTEFRAAGKNVFLVDMHTGFPSNGMSPDGVHPSSPGFLFMAQRWYDAILASYPPVDPSGPPLVTDPPDSGSVGTGGTVTLKVAAQGAGSLSYQWRFNGSDIPGATATTLTLANVQMSAAGSYEVVVSNAFGSVTSNPATLTVLTGSALTNGSFEADLNNWTASGNVQARPGTNPYSATDGANIAAFNTSNSTPNGTLSQLVSTIPGTVYTLTFDLGLLAYSTAPQQIQVTVNGGTSLLSRNISINGPGNGTTRWQPQSLTFTADGGSATLAFRDISSSTNAIDLLLDNVRLTGTSGPSAMPRALVAQPVDTQPDPDLPRPSVTLPPVDEEPGVPTLTGIPGDFTISTLATIPGTYTLEVSDDLIRWQEIEIMNVEVPGLVEFHDRASPGSSPGTPPNRFYRIGRRIGPSTD